MTHRSGLLLAGRLSVHAAELVGRCAAVSAAALRQYSAAGDARSRVWADVLAKPEPGRAAKIEAAEWCHRFRPVLEAIATGSVLVRVAATTMDALGRRFDIPFAKDVARRSVSRHDDAREAALSWVMLHDLPDAELESLNRLGQCCDRLSDMLCGSMMPHVGSDLFVVDRERASDFAETFARRPALLRLTIAQALRRLPAGAITPTGLSQEVERALVACVPGILGISRAAPRRLSFAEATADHDQGLGQEENEADDGATRGRKWHVAFPAIPFAVVASKKWLVKPHA